MLKAEVLINNKLGLHARAAAKLVGITSQFESHIAIGPNSKLVDAKSIMALLMLAATQGTQLLLEVEGNDAEEAMRAIQNLIDNRFDEDE